MAEVNNGGEMVEAVLHQIDPNVAYRAVHASRGKVTRAEPCAALYEQGRAHHAGSFPRLEDQMCALTPDFDRKRAGYSPDRADALVWAITTLVIESGASMGLILWYEREAGKLGTAMNAAPAGLPSPTAKMQVPSTWNDTFFGVSGRKHEFSPGELTDVELADVEPLRRLNFRSVHEAQ